MDGESSFDTQIYRVGINVLVLVGVLFSLLATMGVVSGVKQGDWTPLEVIIGAAGVCFLLLQVLRLEIGPDSFKYRNLSGSREIAFTDVSRAYIQVVRSTSTPQGVATFWIEQRDGRRLKVNLRTFPIQAAAVLFTALESHGIQIEVPDLWAARRMADQVRAAQAKLRG